jgi:hypothetical protein
VEVPGDALAVLPEGQLLDAGVQAGVLDGHTGGGGQANDGLLVDVGEHLGRGLVGEVEVAEHLVAQADRHTQERPHRWVVGR